MASRGINLHPDGFHPSSVSKTTFDVIIIGGGPVSNFAEGRLAKAGLDVAVIQYELYGGECHFFGCLPSKALLRPVEAYEAAKAVAGPCGAIGESKLDVDAIFARRDKLLDNWDDRRWISVDNGSSGAMLMRGFGRIAGEKKVSVQAYGETERRMLEAKVAVIVATGSAHVVPAVPGIEELIEGKELWINRDAVASNIIPEHLIILGAGAVGCEVATFYSTVGAKVTLIASGSEILPRAEPEVAKIVREELEKKGVLFKLSAKAIRIMKKGPNAIDAELSTGDVVSGTVILNATGRKPRTFDMGLETIGMQGKGAALPTGPSFAVPVPGAEKPWLWAVGDVNGLGPTTHMGVYHSRIVTNTILSEVKKERSELRVPPHFDITDGRSSEKTFPQVIFTEPNIGTVGHTFASAQAAGLKVRVADNSFSFPGGWLYGDGQPGWARWVIEEGTERLVGATYCAVEGSEFVNATQVAILQGMSLKEMVHIVPPFPSRGEIWTYLLNAAGY